MSDIHAGLKRGWMVRYITLALWLMLAAILGDAAYADEAQRSFRVGETIEFKFGGMWQEGVIKQVGGELYLVARPQFRMEAAWDWMPAEMIRRKGEAHEGPDPFSQFRYSVGGDPIPQSLNKAKAKYQEFLAKQGTKRARQRMGQRSSPAADAGGASPREGNADPGASTAFNPPITTIDTAGRRTLSMDQLMRAHGATSRATRLDPSPVMPQKAWMISVDSGSDSIFVKPAVFTTSGASALLALLDQNPLGAQSLSVERIDLATGQSTGKAAFAVNSLPMDISSSGQRVAALEYSRLAMERTRVDLWDWSRDQPGFVVSFEGGTNNTGEYITGVHLLGDGSLLVIQNTGDVFNYQAQAQQVTARWTVKLHAASPVQPSPGRQQIALAMGHLVVLIEAATGQTLARLDDPGFTPNQLLFSPDGRYILLVSRHVYARWDLQTGQLSPRYALPPSSKAQQLMVANSGHVYDGLVMLDESTGASLLRYEPGTDVSQATAVAGMLLGAKRDAQSKMCTAWVWPTPAEPALAHAPKGVNLLATGSQIAIDLAALEGDPVQKRQLESNLTSHFTRLGMTVSPSAATRLVGQTTSKTEQQSFRRFGSGFGNGETVNVTTRISKLTLEHQGQALWSATTTTGLKGFSFQLMEGETLQQAVDRQTQPDLTMLQTVPLPQIAAAPQQPMDVHERRLGQ